MDFKFIWLINFGFQVYMTYYFWFSSLSDLLILVFKFIRIPLSVFELLVGLLNDFHTLQCCCWDMLSIPHIAVLLLRYAEYCHTLQCCCWDMLSISHITVLLLRYAEYSTHCSVVAEICWVFHTLQCCCWDMLSIATHCSVVAEICWVLPHITVLLLRYAEYCHTLQYCCWVLVYFVVYWFIFLQDDQKNIRRRVYDALNVLMAMDIISKEKKEIQWLGLPTNTAQECTKLTHERNKRAERIKLKTQQLHDLILQVL